MRWSSVFLEDVVIRILIQLRKRPVFKHVQVIYNGSILFGRGARGSVVGSRHYATSGKVAGSSPDEVDFFNLPNPSSRTMALG
jgi:hypothetical protein